MRLLGTLIGRKISGSAAIIGGGVWLLFWTFHTIAHGPQNPAPTDGRFLGYTSLEHAQLMLRTAPPFLVFALIGMLHHESRGLGKTGKVGLVCTSGALVTMCTVSLGLGPWELYALSVVGLCVGLALLGIGTLYLRGWSLGSRWAPLITSIVIPAIVIARWPGSPLLQTGNVMGYALLEGIGAAFAFCWVALGYGLGWSSRNSTAFIQPSDLRRLN